MQQNTDYELIPDDDQGWNCRILTGDFIETVFKFGALQVTEDGEHLKYNAEVIYSPSEILEEDENWHQVTGEILLDLLNEAMVKDELGTNNSTEYSD